MKRTFVALVAALLVLGGCGSDDPPKPEETTRPRRRNRARRRNRQQSPPGHRRPRTSSSSPAGSARPVVGMSKDDAVKTGMFDVELPPPVEGCPPYPLKWKKQYKGLDVLTRDDESISSIGISKGGPKTKKGIGYGSTLDDLTQAYPNLSPVVDAGFSQAGAYEYNDKDEFIGFLFGDATVTTVKGSSKITFIEVTTGTSPTSSVRAADHRTAASASGKVNAPA